MAATTDIPTPRPGLEIVHMQSALRAAPMVDRVSIAGIATIGRGPEREKKGFRDFRGCEIIAKCD